MTPYGRRIAGQGDKARESAPLPGHGDFFWLDRPEPDEQELDRDPLRLSQYYSNMSTTMLPSLSTLTSYGPLYYVFALWADPRRPVPNGLFEHLPGRATLTKRIRERAYNRAEWALTYLNADNRHIKPIGIRSVPKSFDRDGAGLPDGSEGKTQNALVRYGGKAAAIMEKLVPLVERLSANESVLMFFRKAVDGRYRPGTLNRMGRALLHLETSPVNHGVVQAVAEVSTICGLPQGAFLSRRHRGAAQLCVDYGECERALGRVALKLFYRMLKASSKGRVQPVQLTRQEMRTVRNLIRSEAKLIRGSSAVERVRHNTAFSRPVILRGLAESAEGTGQLRPGDFQSDWLVGDRWRDGKREFVRRFLDRNSEDTLNVHDLCRGNAARMVEYGR